jgi:hypothetical protein
VASEAEHIARARYNENFARELSTNRHAEWKIIASFYAALHYVEATIVKSGGKSTDHSSRAEWVRRLSPLRKVSAEYFSLSNYAWEARYDPTTSFSKEKSVQAICDLLPVVRQGLGY